MTVRMAFLIAGITAIALCAIHLRRREMNMQHRVHAIELEKPSLKRQLWDRQAEMGRKTSPAAIRRNMHRKAIEMNFPSRVEGDETPGGSDVSG